MIVMQSVVFVRVHFIFFLRMYVYVSESNDKTCLFLLSFSLLAAATTHSRPRIVFRFMSSLKFHTFGGTPAVKSL